MAIDRDKIEQDAMRLLQKGHNDRALERYLALLRDDPRDRRVRQRVAELYAALGKVAEAERHFREIVRALVTSGQERAAIGVIKQLLALVPEDAELKGLLGDCYAASGFPVDARACYEQAVEMLCRVYPHKAVDFQRKLIRLAPGELPLRVRLAELLEAANWTEAAFGEWRALGAEARRLGRPDDQARFLELGLRLRPDVAEVLLDAAEALLAGGNPQGALPHLQKAYATTSGSKRTLTLLARAFEGIDQPEKARPAWLEAARAHEAEGNVVERAEALKRAIACGADDPDVQAEFGEAERAAARHRLRLTERPWAEPRTDEEVRVVVRARVLATYGFPDRARAALEGAPPGLRESVAMRVAMAELFAANGEVEAAVSELRRVQPTSPEMAQDLQQRLAVLGGGATAPGPSAPSAAVDDFAEDDLVDDDMGDDTEDGPIGLQRGSPPDPRVLEDVSFSDLAAERFRSPDVGFFVKGNGDRAGADPLTDPGSTADDEREGDRLAAAGDRAGAIAMYRRALAEDPASEVLLRKVAELIAGGSTRADLSPPPHGTPAVFAEIEDDDEDDDAFDDFGAPEPAAPAADGGALTDARAWLAVGRPDRALARLEGNTCLAAITLAAAALRAQGDLTAALGRLRDAVGDASESDPDYPDALFELAAMTAASGKARAARRLLDELDDLASGFRAPEVRSLRHGLELLEQG